MDKITVYRGNNRDLPKGASTTDVFFTTDTNTVFSGNGPFNRLTTYSSVVVLESREQLPLIGSSRNLYVIHNRHQTDLLIWDDTERVYITDANMIFKGVDSNVALKYGDSCFTIINVNTYEDITLTLPEITQDNFTFRFLNISDRYLVNIKATNQNIFIPYTHVSAQINTPVVSLRGNGYLALYGNARGLYVRAGMNNLEFDKFLWAQDRAIGWNRPKHLSS